MILPSSLLCFFPSPPRSVLLLLHSTRSTLGYQQWLTVRENNNPRRRAKIESEAGHFMDSKGKKLYYFIQLELLLLKHLTNIFWRRAISKVLKITSSGHRVVWRAQDPRVALKTNYCTLVENSRQRLLDRYFFSRLLTCICPQDFLNGRCNMDCKPSIVFTGYLDPIC